MGRNRLRTGRVVRPFPYATPFPNSAVAEKSVGCVITAGTQSVHIPSRKSEMLRPVRDISSNTADVPSPSGDCALIPTQIDAG